MSDAIQVFNHTEFGSIRTVADGGEVRFLLVRELAHVLRQSGVEIGERRLFQWMRDNGYLEKHRNEPTQRCLELGLMRVVVGSYVGSDGRNMTTRTAKITGKGQQYFVEKFLAREKAVA